MPEELDTPHEPALPAAAESPVKRKFFARKRLRSVLIAVGVFVLLLGIFSVVLFRSGAVDSVVKNQFREKMEYMGIVFDADVFRLNISPLELELKNATFNDRISGEKLFFVRDGRLGLTVLDLFAWQTTREISVDSTEIYGAEVWVRFDENGRSNFANLVSDERESRLSFKYDSIKFLLLDSVIHFNDVSRKIDADARNLTVSITPEQEQLLDRPSRFRFEMESTDSFFTYDGGRLENIGIRAKGVADPEFADISELRIDTPIGYSILSGRLTDWQKFSYELSIESSLDLTQTSTIFPLGTSLRGVGNFKGKVVGTGTDYRLEGTASSDALVADGDYVRGIEGADPPADRAAGGDARNSARADPGEGARGGGGGAADACGRCEAGARSAVERAFSLRASGSEVHASRVPHLRSGVSVARFGGGAAHGVRHHPAAHPGGGGFEPHRHCHSRAADAKVSRQRVLIRKDRPSWAGPSHRTRRRIRAPGR